MLLSDGRRPQLAELPDEAALEALLEATAAKGRFEQTGWGDGPWSWLQEEVTFRPWVQESLAEVVSRVAARTAAGAHAALDWMGDGWDLWRFEALLDGWHQAPPPWWGIDAKARPPGWKRSIRPAVWFGVQALSDVVIQLRTRARHQAASRPDLDLARLA